MGELERIVDRVSAELGTPEGQPAPLAGGITNHNFRIRFGDRDYVLRLPGKDTALLGISRETERLAGETAARLGIGPAVAYADDACIVTSFVPGVPATPAELSADPEPVARALRAFHDSGVILPVRFWVPDLLDGYADLVGGAVPAQYEPTRSLARRIAQVLPLTEPRPCHNDLLPANVLRGPGGSVALVDWEYAGMGHPWFDLGNLAVNAEFDAAAEERLLSAYFQEPPTDSRRAALALMRIMSDAREAAWGVVQGAVSELEFDFDSYAARHFARLEAAAGDPSLPDWLELAGSWPGSVRG